MVHKLRTPILVLYIILYIEPWTLTNTSATSPKISRHARQPNEQTDESELTDQSKIVVPRYALPDPGLFDMFIKPAVRRPLSSSDQRLKSESPSFSNTVSRPDPNDSPIVDTYTPPTNVKDPYRPPTKPPKRSSRPPPLPPANPEKPNLPTQGLALGNGYGEVKTYNSDEEREEIYGGNNSKEKNTTPK